MIMNKVLLIQKEDSPLETLVDQALSRHLGSAVLRAQSAELPPIAEAESLVLWDLSGFSDDEAQIISPQLARRGSMVVMACDKVDEFACALVDQAAADESAGRPAPRVVGLVPAPAQPEQFASLIQPSLEHAARIMALEAEVRRLEEELDNRRIIERAKYSLMFARDLSEEQAYHSMRQYCRSRNLRMVEVAKRILETHSIFIGS